MEQQEAYRVRDGVEVRVPVYTVTMVCPLCHQPMSFEKVGMTTCPHCGRQFVVKSTTDSGNTR